MHGCVRCGLCAHFLTFDGHVVIDLDDDASGQELAREEEQVGIIEHDQEFEELAHRLVGAGGRAQRGVGHGGGLTVRVSLLSPLSFSFSKINTF